MILIDKHIRQRCSGDLFEYRRREYGEEPMIENFVDYHGKIEGRISSGLTSCGYDMRPIRDWRIFCNNNCTFIDPMNFDPNNFIVKNDVDFILLPPNHYALTSSIEFFRIPPEFECVVLGKSTYARSGIIVNVTPLEPGWKGNVTIEVSNSTPLPVKIYSEMGIAQVQFHQLSGEPERLYGDRSGLYQDQRGITLPRVQGYEKNV